MRRIFLKRKRKRGSGREDIRGEKMIYVIRFDVEIIRMFCEVWNMYLLYLQIWDYNYFRLKWRLRGDYVFLD